MSPKCKISKRSKSKGSQGFKGSCYNCGKIDHKSIAPCFFKEKQGQHGRGNY